MLMVIGVPLALVGAPLAACDARLDDAAHPSRAAA
jgi:hypothetical protein